MAGSSDAGALESMGWSPGGIQGGTPGAGGAALALVRAGRVLCLRGRGQVQQSTSARLSVALRTRVES